MLHHRFAMAQHFELGEPKVPEEVAAAAGDGDERGSMYSSCGSLSFVITDDGDIERLPEPVSTTADTVLNSYMTQSQYAQVMLRSLLSLIELLVLISYIVKLCLLLNLI